jgi:CheY-like chemotaxis protein
MYQKYNQYPELNRLVGAAAVSKQFRRMLLRDPERVLERGYLDYRFDLSTEEAALVKGAAAVGDARGFSLRVWEWMDHSHPGERLSQTGLPFEHAFAGTPASMVPVPVARVEEPVPEPEPSSWDWRTAMEPLILVVENNREMARGLRFALEMEGFQVALAFNGETAVKFLKQRRPDLILAGVKIPHLDGYALLRTVKKHIEWRTIPFVFVTAAADWRQAVTAKSMGADDYIVKPFELEDLMKVVKRLTKAAEKAETPPADELNCEANQGY